MTLPGAQSAGNLIVVAVGWHNDLFVAPPVLFDSAGNAYDLAVFPFVQLTSTDTVVEAIYYAMNIHAAAANANTLTVTFDSPALSPTVSVAEYSGLSVTNPVDTVSVSGGTGATADSGLATTITPNDLLVGVGVPDLNSGISAGAGYTARVLGPLIEDRIVTSVGTYSATGSLTGSTSGWVMGMVAFRPASSDTQPPTAPTGLTATAVSSSQINLAWTASTDDVGVAAYEVERCTGAGCATFAPIARVAGTTYSDNSGTSPSTTYQYFVQAIDAAGNFSSPSAIVSATTQAPDTQAPSTPTGLTATGVSAGQVDLSWTASTDNVGVAAYSVERCTGSGCSSFQEIGTSTGTTYNDRGLTASTTYRYRVRARDAAFNYSNYSSTKNATTPATDTLAPTAPSGLAAAAVSSTQINLSWTASIDDVGVTGYFVERCQGLGCSNFVQIATPTGTTYTDTGLSVSTDYSYRVRAADAVPNLSEYSNTASATTQAPDTQPPTTPTNLAATVVSSSQINLSWTASTDNVGVVNYLLERCEGSGCSNFTQIATPVGTTYSDTGLATSTTYSYRVRAADAVPNLSAYSNTATATASGPISPGQSGFAAPPGSATSVSATFIGAQTAGDTNVIAIGWRTPTASIQSVTDSLGNTYMLAVGPTILPGVGAHAIYYASGIAAAPSGSNTVTVTFNTAADSPDVRIAEYSGIDTGDPIDAIASATGSGTTSDSGTVTTVTPNTLLVGANLVTTATTDAGAGYVVRSISSPNGDILEDRIVSTAGSYSATAPLSASGQWIMQIVAFRWLGSGPCN